MTQVVPSQGAIVTSIRETIFAANDIKSEKVEVPEWGVTVEVRTMTALDRTRLQSAAASGEGKVDMTKFMPDAVIASVFDPETGLPIFTEKDRDALLSKSGTVVERLAQTALNMSGMGADSVDKAGAEFPETTREATAV